MKLSTSRIDLRSDTVTVPTADMRAAMANAVVGDDVYDEDTTVQELEREVAAICGKEAGLFVPSGTMGNQIGIHLHTRSGESILTEREAHVFLYEAGAASALSGVQFDLIPHEENWSQDALVAHFKTDNMHSAATSLIVMENSHNRAAGRVYSLETIARVTSFAQSKNVPMHCDGARIWNASAALGVSERELLKPFLTASVCLSKGLGAPVGSVLVGPQSMMGRARKIRKRWGGQMRQVGIIAAGGLHAVRHHREFLKEDHRRAGLFATQLRSFGSIDVKYPDPGTNLVYFRINGRDGDALAKNYGEQGLILNHLGHNWMRAVFHFQVDDAMTARAIEVVKQNL